jgi:hypothetical protein
MQITLMELFKITYRYVLVIVFEELSEVLHRRVVIIESLTMAELSHPRLLEMMSRANEFRISYIYKENSTSSHNAGTNLSLWEG